MYLLRRAAVRVLVSQPSRSISTVQSRTTRVPLPQSAKPLLSRTFHQTRTWLAEEQEKKLGESSQAPGAEAEITETLKEDATVAAEVAESAAEVADAAAQAAVEESSPVAAEQAEEVATTAAESATVAAQASTAAAAATQSSPAQSSPFRQPFASSDASAGSSFRDVRPSRILYIGNLFFEVTAPQIEAEFARFGEIVNSRIVTDARGLSKGFGYLEFAHQDAADRAVRELDQKVFQGRRMAVQYHVRREPRRFGGMNSQAGSNPPSKTLFIGNMSYQMSDRDLNDLFREIRDVLDVRVAIDRRSGQPRGFAHADFIDIAAAERAKAHLEKKVVYGRQLRVDFSSSSSSSQTA